jgi:cytochrome P450
VVSAFQLSPSPNHFHHHQRKTTITVLHSNNIVGSGDMYTTDTTTIWNEKTLSEEKNKITTRKPKPLPFTTGIGYLWHVFRGDVHIYQHRLAQKYDTDSYIIWNKYVTLIDKDAIRDCLYLYNLEKPEDIKVGYRAFFFPTGGILAASWKDWIQQRRLTSPALSENVVGKQAPKFQQAAVPFFDILEEACSNNEVLEMDYLFTCLTMDTIGLILLGRTFGLLEQIRDVDSDEEVPFQQALNVMAKHSLDEMVYGFLPKRLNKLLRKPPNKVLRAKDTLDKFLDDCIEKRLSTGIVDSETDTNLLNILLEAEREGVLTRDELKAQLLLFVYAGYDTTAHTLAFLLYEVAIHPELQEKLFQESKAALPNRNDFPLDPNILLSGLPLLDQVWLETLRLHPATATGTTRVVGDEPIVVGDGLELPAKSTISMSTYAYHRNPKYWKDPETFDPSRFDPSEMKDRDPITLMSFSAGPRNCLGSRLARAEALSIMSCLIRRYHITCVEEKEPATYQSLTTRPRDGIRFTFERRE